MSKWYLFIGFRTCLFPYMLWAASLRMQSTKTFVCGCCCLLTCALVWRSVPLISEWCWRVVREMAPQLTPGKVCKFCTMCYLGYGHHKAFTNTMVVGIQGNKHNLSWLVCDDERVDFYHRVGRLYM